MGDTLTKITSEEAREIVAQILTNYSECYYHKHDVSVEVDKDHGNVIEFTVWTSDDEGDDVELGEFVVTVR
jgi:hypothetical protein